MALSRPALLAAALLLLPMAAQGETGAEAFERQDYERAAALWRDEAAEGSAEAKFGLGLIYDLGLGAPRSSSAALRWYLEAAGDGLADAQFNVAVMFDAGTGVARNPAAAAAWYARAAANGHARAQYNLGLLYEGGVGVPRNPDLARAWLEAAGPTLAAAAERLRQLPLEPSMVGGPAPQPVTEAVVETPDRSRAELVWTAEPGGTAFRVEVARLPPDGAGPGQGDVLLSQEVGRSAVALDLPAGEDGLLWRVGREDPEGAEPAWSAWRALSQEPAAEAEPGVGAEGGPGRVTIYVGRDDRLARSFAEELSGAFSRGGVAVAIRDAAQPPSATTVEYRYPGDAALAASVADLLPVLEDDSAVRVPAADVAPGEVAVRLAGGPVPASDPSPTPAAEPGG